MFNMNKRWEICRQIAKHKTTQIDDDDNDNDDDHHPTIQTINL